MFDLLIRREDITKRTEKSFKIARREPRTARNDISKHSATARTSIQDRDDQAQRREISTAHMPGNVEEHRGNTLPNKSSDTFQHREDIDAGTVPPVINIS